MFEITPIAILYLQFCMIVYAFVFFGKIINVMSNNFDHEKYFNIRVTYTHLIKLQIRKTIEMGIIYFGYKRIGIFVVIIDFLACAIYSMILKSRKRCVCCKDASKLV